eukprot:2791202-Amphidinium_carterae.1
MLHVVMLPVRKCWMFEDPQGKRLPASIKGLDCALIKDYRQKNYLPGSRTTIFFRSVAVTNLKSNEHQLFADCHYRY